MAHPWCLVGVLTLHVLFTKATTELSQAGNRQRQSLVRRENIVDDSSEDADAGESLSASTKNRTDTNWDSSGAELLERIAAVGRHIAYDFARNQPVHAASLLQGAAVRHGRASPMVNGGLQRWLHVVVKNCTAPAAVHKHNANFAEALGAGFAIRCYDDATMAAHVKEWLPEYAEAFDKLPRTVMKADVFRYMAVWHEGGFYADDDVVIFPGFKSSIANAEQTTSLFLGWERREHAAPSTYMWCKEYVGNGFNYTDMRCEPGEPHCMMCNSLAQYIFGAKARHPFLKDLIDHIMRLFLVDDFQELLMHDKSDDEYVLYSTGPVTFSMQLLRYVAFKDVLDIVVFGCGQTHSDAPPCLWRNNKIWGRHLFEGKWRNLESQQKWYRKLPYMLVCAFLALWVLHFLRENARTTGLIRREPSAFKQHEDLLSRNVPIRKRTTGAALQSGRMPWDNYNYDELRYSRRLTR